MILVAFFVEVGLLLLVLPWSAFWETNYFASVWPDLLPVMTNDYVRGAISGIGLINLWAGVRELMAVFTLRDVRRAQPSMDGVTDVYGSAADRLEP